MRTVFLATLVAMTVNVGVAWAQEHRDHWATERECQAAVSAPNYVARTEDVCPLQKNERILPHPTGGCLQIKVPLGESGDYPTPGRGWGRFPKGEPFVYKMTDGGEVIDRMPKCCNDVYAEAPFSSPTTESAPATSAPVASPTPVTASAMQIAGSVTVNHQGTVGVKFLNPLFNQNDEATPAPRHHPLSWARHGKWVWPVVTAGAVVGTTCAVKKCWTVNQTVYYPAP